MKKKNTGNYTIEVSEEIRRLFLKALNKKGWYFFNNPNLSRCWEVRNCTNTHCPSYHASDLRCWHVSGTFCRGKPHGEFAKKIGDCHKCIVYKKATKGDILLKIGEEFNNLMFHLKEKEDELKFSIRRTHEKNRELEASNRKIKSLVEKLDNKNMLLRELSIRDALTGLYNYRFFIEILNEQFNLAKRFKFPLSCIMIDIDYFKAINDTYGHQVGDAILKQLAGILKKNVREADKVVRYGGEEFAIILPYTDCDDAYIKAERLRELTSDFLFRSKGKTVGITISLGIASYPVTRKIKRAEHLVSLADKALYQAKQRGRNQTVLYTGNVTSRERSKREHEGICFIERRKHPRIQALIEIGSGTDKEALALSNTFDISFAGLSFLSVRQIDANKILNVKLYLPALGKAPQGTKQIDLEGLVVWCKQIHYFLDRRAGSRHRNKTGYMVGIQFSNISSKDCVYLQKYFVSMFKN